jgi:hypothetical protein
VDFILATVVFPAALLALALGAGLLVDRASGVRIPGVLLAPLGLALLVGIGQMLTWQSDLAPASVPAVWILGIAGLAVGWRRLRHAEPDPWAIAAGLGAYFVICAPVLLAGRPTLTGYLLDTTGGIQLIGAEFLPESGRDFSAVPFSTLRGTLEAYFGREYPAGAHVLLGTVGRPFPTPLIWLYQPFLSLLAALCAPTAYWLLRRLEAPAWLAALGGMTSAMPALVYAYVQQGSIKEIALLPILLLLAAILLLARELWTAGPRGAIPLGVVGAGGVGAVGLAFGAWFGLVALTALAIALVAAPAAQRTTREVLIRLLPAAAVFLVLSVPVLASFSDAFAVGNTFDQDSAVAVADPGNLLRPLLKEQVSGVWLHGSHRVDPGRFLQETYILIGVVALAALLGIALIIRYRLFAIGAFFLVALVVWAVLTNKGTAWTDGKLLMISSPAVMLLAFMGATNLVRGGFRWVGGALALVLAGGVLASNAMTYHDTNLAPTERFDELLDIGERFAGQGPTLVPDFDEYSFFALNDMAPEGPGFASRTERTAFLRDGTTPGYGLSYDIDLLQPEQVRRFPIIVMRRSPEQSRPPSGFELAFQGDWYEVWVRREKLEVVAHTPGGGKHRADSRLGCRTLRDTARQAEGRTSSLNFAQRARTVVIDPSRQRRSAGWVELDEGISLVGPGELRARFEIANAGEYLLWFKGAFSRAVEVFVDGERVGEVAYDSGGDGNYAKPIRIHVSAGRHELELAKGGGTLRPGDAAASSLLAIVVQPVERLGVRSLETTQWRKVCRKPLDWAEVVTSNRPGFASAP